MDDYVVVVQVHAEQDGITTNHVQYEDKSELGMVVGAGSNTNLNVEDIVFFNKYSTTSVQDADVEFLILRKEDVICKAKTT